MTTKLLRAAGAAAAWCHGRDAGKCLKHCRVGSVGLLVSHLIVAGVCARAGVCVHVCVCMRVCVRACVCV